MSDPYRGSDPLLCPACGETLREFNGRLCCDACTGIMLPLADLEAAIAGELPTALPPSFVDGKPGARACPRCRAAMEVCHLRVDVADKHPKLKPTLDRCRAHGVWFDVDELAKILAVLHHAGEPPSHATMSEIASTLAEQLGEGIRRRGGL